MPFKIKETYQGTNTFTWRSSRGIPNIRRTYSSEMIFIFEKVTDTCGYLKNLKTGKYLGVENNAQIIENSMKNFQFCFYGLDANQNVKMEVTDGSTTRSIVINDGNNIFSAPLDAYSSYNQNYKRWIEFSSNLLRN